MTDYTDKALQSSANRRRILNAGDSNTVNATHEFKATTTIGGLIVDEDSHKGGTSDANAGKISTDRGHGTIELDGQEIIVSRTGGSVWNSLILSGNDPTSSTVELTHGTNKRIGYTNVSGFRIGYCAVSAHTATAFSGGLEVERNNAFFLQSGSGATLSNILDVSLSDGEVYFYKGLRSTDDSGIIKLSGHTIEAQSKASLSSGSNVGIISFKGDNSGGTTKAFAQVIGRANDPSDGLEVGQVDIKVLGSAGLLTAISAYAVGSSSSKVKISDSWTLPSDQGSNNQVLTSNGTGGSSWASVASDLDAITDNGSTTSNSLTTGSLLPNASSDTLGSSSAPWSDLHLKSGGKIYFGNSDVSLDSSTGVGLILNMASEGNHEPKFQIKSDAQSNTSGPTLSILSASVPSTNEIIGAINLSAHDSGSTERDYAVIDALALDTTSSAVDGSVRLKVAVNSAVGTGLEVYSNGSARIVKVSNTWTLPSVTGSNGQILTTDGSGASSWSDAPSSIASSSVGDLNDVTLGGITLAEGQVLRVSSDNSTIVNAVLSYNDLSDKPTLGSSAAKDAGTSDGEVLLLDADNALPAISGSSLTALPSIDKTPDVDITTNAPTGGQILHWVSADSKFVPTTPAYYTDENARDAVGAALNGGTHSGVESITFTNDDSADKINLSLEVKTGNLSDIDTTSPTNNQVLRYTTDSGLNKYKPASLGTAADVNVGTEPSQVPSISDHYLATGTHAEKGDLIIFGRVLETIDYGSVATTWTSANHFSIDFGLITDTLLYASEDYGVLVA